MRLDLPLAIRLLVLHDEDAVLWRDGSFLRTREGWEEHLEDKKQRFARQLGLARPRLPLEQLDLIWPRRADGVRLDRVDRAEAALGLVGEALAHLAGSCLAVRGVHPIPRDGRLLELHEVGLHMFAEQVRCWAVAEALVRSGHRRIPRSQLDWYPWLDMEDPHLLRVLERELVDNHVHLGGVLGTADLWSGVLDPALRSERLAKLGPPSASDPSKTAHSVLGSDPLPLQVKSRLEDARVLRDMLQLQLRCSDLLPGPVLPVDFRKAEAMLVAWMSAEIGLTRDLDHPSEQLGLQMELARRPVLPELLSPWVREVRDAFQPDEDLHLLAERELLVHAFAAVLGESAQLPAWFAPVLTVYLATQNHFHRAVTQEAQRVGLGNFLEWYDHPARDLGGSKAMVLKRATEDRRVRLEGRCTPSESKIRSWLDAWRVCGEGHDLQLGRDFGLVVHFIKEPDLLRPAPGAVGTATLPPRLRHCVLRGKLQRQSIDLEALRAVDPEVAVGVRGIDAARGETDVPPEVFGPTFRFLRRRFPEGHARDDVLGRAPTAPDPLRATFHAGESTTHPLCGLRTVDEAIRFLDLRPGDRIGHGTLLGVEYERWVSTIGEQPALTRGERLDTLVWAAWRLRGEARKDPAGLHRLAGEFSSLDALIASEFSHLYGAKRGSNLALADALGHAWELRWMDPQVLFGVLGALGWEDGDLPKDAQVHGRPRVGKELQQAFGAGVRPSAAALRALAERGYAGTELAWRIAVADPEPILTGDVPPAAVRYLWIHHYDVRHDALRQEPVGWGDDFPDPALLFSALRDLILDEVRRRRLTVEVCPSSNERIGAFGEMQDHPVFRLDAARLGKRGGGEPAIRVTVCTDDPGIFATSTSHEYALLAEAARRQEVPPDDVLDWIDHLRRRGVGATFLRRTGLDQQPPPEVQAWPPAMAHHPEWRRSAWRKAVLDLEGRREERRLLDRFRRELDLPPSEV